MFALTHHNSHHWYGLVVPFGHLAKASLFSRHESVGSVKLDGDVDDDDDTPQSHTMSALVIFCWAGLEMPLPLAHPLQTLA